MWVLRVYCMSCIIFIDLLPYWSHKRCLLGFSLLTRVCNLKFALLCYQMMWKINLSVLHKIIILTLCFSLLPAVIWYFSSPLQTSVYMCIKAYGKNYLFFDIFYWSWLIEIIFFWFSVFRKMTSWCRLYYGTLVRM